ncbi:MAG: aminotransferase class V-fold PLP-dependent enzyme [Gemmatimonadetes bacterium]|nr:aminotransferase class V-fold PLP-dependent enzyme [Gemmatimonadota bacterium]NNF13834.1 aminotransferase class V-fold PLP-dependent enzyme [Gemmatimonadota bacterium]NNL29467.1 aminotransferase class V-fold PLP-dependent enzyme [Gemmatimonadota bacterium]
MGPLPRVAEEAGIAAIRRKSVPTRIVPPDAFWETDRLRELFARLVGVDDPTRIAIQPGVSYGVATAARNLSVGAGDNVVITHEQFPGNVYSWRRMAGDAGAELRAVGPGDGSDVGGGRGRRWNERLLEAVDARTAIVAVPVVHWTDGTWFDLDALAARCRDVGAALVVDATQSVGALAFDVAKVRPDALIVAAYKWLLGPYSLSLAYYGPRFDDGDPLEETWIAREKSSDFQNLVDYQDEYVGGAIRYDVAERSNFFLAPIAAASLELLNEWGPHRIQEYCRRLTREFLDEAGELGYTVEDEAWRGAHLFGLRMPASVDLTALRDALTARNVSASLRGTALRLSPNVYNDETDMGVLLDVLKGAVR